MGSVPMAAAAPQPPDPNVEEVRVALALNGGVSLAVWMGGCAVELDCARRAYDEPEAESASPGSEARERPRLSRRVGSFVGKHWRLFTTGERPLPEPVSPPEHPERSLYRSLEHLFRRRLVIDVLSGSSAGGINGALLAAATRWNRQLDPSFIRERWLELGDFAGILHETSNPAPRSLMQGEKLHAALLSVFETLRKGDDERVVWGGPVDAEAAEPVLDVTSTNVAGEKRTFDDVWDQRFEAREYRAKFGFRTGEDFQPSLLAEASRASASFPGAFEPWRLSSEAARLAGLGGTRWMIDGGLLDNTPIRAALELIPTRSSRRIGERYVCYIDPDPADHLPPPRDPPEPTLPAVAGYVTGLPRKASVVDQLYAISEASARRPLGTETEWKLLVDLNRRALYAAARAQLPAYGENRALASLVEILLGSAPAEAALARLDHRPELLPWIPSALPAGSADLGWGIRPAQRALELLGGLIRSTASRLAEGERGPLLAAQAEIADRIAGLETWRASLIVDPGIRTALTRKDLRGDDLARQLARLTHGYRAQALSDLRRGAELTLSVSPQIANVVKSPQTAPGTRESALCEALFGRRWNPDETEVLSNAAFGHLLRGLMAVEVLRRAFLTESDLEPDERINFAQLTPRTPVAVFATADGAFPEGPNNEAAKLTGTHLGHFAGFYRRSWRVNDFMWGRLDASQRIVEMLVPRHGSYRDEDRGEESGPSIANQLATILVPEDAGADRLWLMQDALPGDPPKSPLSIAGLRKRLTEALEEDLENRRELTRRLCALAAQQEILLEELPHLVGASREDEKLGSATAALTLETDSLRPAVEQLRTDLDEGMTLPKQLGRDNRAELGSPLALRTLSHAGLVSLAVLRNTKLPMTSIVYGARALILPVSGVVARAPINRLAVALGFWAAALLLTARVLDIPDPHPSAEVGLLVSKNTILAFLAFMVVLGVVLVPALRTASLTGARKWMQLGITVLFLACGGVAATAMARAWGDLKWSQALLAPGADMTPEATAGILIALLVGPVAASLVPSFLKATLDRPGVRGLALAALAAAAGSVVATSLPGILDALDEGGWERAAAILALVALPAILLYVFVPSPAYQVKRVTGRD